MSRKYRIGIRTPLDWKREAAPCFFKDIPHIRKHRSIKPKDYDENDIQTFTTLKAKELISLIPPPRFIKNHQRYPPIGHGKIRDAIPKSTKSNCQKTPNTPKRVGGKLFKNTHVKNRMFFVIKQMQQKIVVGIWRLRWSFYKVQLRHSYQKGFVFSRKALFFHHSGAPAFL